MRVHWLSLNTSQTGPLKQYGEQYRTKVNHMAGVWVCNLFLTLAPLITRLMLSYKNTYIVELLRILMKKINQCIKVTFVVKFSVEQYF